MSSGAAVIPLAALFLIPAAMAAVVVAAAVATVGAVVVLMARAAMTGAQALAGGLVRLGERMDAQRDAYFEARQASELWQLAAVEVARRNARIASMSKQAKAAGAGPDVPIPPPLDLAGKNLCEIRDWCERVDEQLAQVRARLDSAIVTATTRRLTALLPAANAELVSAADALARGQLAADLAEVKMRERADKEAARAAVTASASRQRELKAIASRVDLLLADLAPGAFADDQARVAASAARAVAAEPPETGRLYVEDLRVIISEANRRAEDADDASYLLQGLGFDPLPGELDGQDLAVIDRLERVAAGESGLDDALRADAQRVLRKVEAGGLEMFLREQITQIMADNGWDVEGDFSTLLPGRDNITLTRSDWPEHHLRIFLDGSELRYLTLRDYEVAGDQAARLDHERCAQSASSMQALVETLNSRGAGVASLAQRTDPPVQYLGPRRDIRDDRSHQQPVMRKLNQRTTKE